MITCGREMTWGGKGEQAHEERSEGWEAGREDGDCWFGRHPDGRREEVPFRNIRLATGGFGGWTGPTGCVFAVIMSEYYQADHRDGGDTGRGRSGQCTFSDKRKTAQERKGKAYTRPEKNIPVRTHF